MSTPEPAPGQAARTPGQADDVPAVFARYQLATFPTDLADFAANETAMRWKHLTGEAERKFWRELDAAQERPAPGLRAEVEALARTLLEESAPYPGEDAAEVARRGGFGYAASELTQVLAKHPAPAGERPAPGELADWWVCDGPLPDGKKILGPFATQELALTVRSHVEKAQQRDDLWVDDEPQAAPADAKPDLGTAWRLLDEARALAERLHLERDQARGQQTETAGELVKLKARHAEWLARFTSNGSSGYTARVSGTVLARAYAQANLPVRDDLSHLARP